MQQLYIHCGLHKTGTTSLQSTLWDNAGVLRSRGFLYPEIGVPRSINLATRARFTGQHGIAWQLARDRRFDETEGTFAELMHAVAAFGGDAVISSEDFESSLLHPDVWLPLANLAAGKGIALHFVIYLRDVAGYLESLFFEQTGTGHGLEYAIFAREALQHGRMLMFESEFCFDYDKIRASMRAVPNSTITFRSYNDLARGSVLYDFLSILDPSGSLFDAFGEERRQNTRSSLEAMTYLYLKSRDRRLDPPPGGALHRLVGEVFEGKSVRATTPRRLRAVLAQRLTTNIFSDRKDYARNFLEASQADRMPAADGDTAVVNIARMFSVETQAAFRRLQRMEHAGGVSPEWKAEQIERWWAWVSDLS
jgi:hypothetical protein